MIQSEGCLVLDPDAIGHGSERSDSGEGGIDMARQRRTGDVNAKPGDPGFPDPSVVIPQPEMKDLRPGQKREFGFSYNVPADLMPWIEATKRRHGFSSLADAVLFYLAKAGGFEFKPIGGRKGFAAATKKKKQEALKKRIEVVRERIEREAANGER